MSHPASDPTPPATPPGEAPLAPTLPPHAKRPDLRDALGLEAHCEVLECPCGTLCVAELEEHDTSGFSEEHFGVACVTYEICPVACAAGELKKTGLEIQRFVLTIPRHRIAEGHRTIDDLCAELERQASQRVRQHKAAEAQFAARKLKRVRTAVDHGPAFAAERTLHTRMTPTVNPPLAA